MLDSLLSPEGITVGLSSPSVALRNAMVALAACWFSPGDAGWVQMPLALSEECRVASLA